MFDFAQLPFSFDVPLLLADLHLCLQKQWAPHFNTADFDGSWEVIALRSKTGNMTDIVANSQSGFLDTRLMHDCRYFKEVVDSFECNKEAVRLMNLKAGSEIKTHKDNAGGYADGFCRVHIPIVTDEKVQFMVNGQRVPMKAGEAWYANFSLPHSVHNYSSHDRVHLVIDCQRNTWTDRLFEQLGYDFEAENNKNYDESTLLEMIIHLEKMNTDTSLDMAKKIKEKLSS